MFFPLNEIHMLPDIVEIPASIQADVSQFPASNLWTSAIYNTCALLIVLPLLILYLFCQRYLVQGIERSGIVG